MTKLSLCLIVKNEEADLARCLESVQGLVDEIILVDTGSTDKTKEIAARFGAKIFDFKWIDNFSLARNESLKQATGDWILVLDADEALAKKDHEKLRELIESSEAEAHLLIARNYFKSPADLAYGSFSGLNVKGIVPGEFVFSAGDSYLESRGTLGWIPAPVIRLFRKREGIAFSGQVHEDISPSIKGKIGESPIPLHHFGKINIDKCKKKEELYERLGEKRLEEEKDYLACFELGRQYMERKKIDSAKEMFQKSISLKNDFWMSWFNLGSLELIENKLDSAIPKLEEAKKLKPGIAAICINLGVAYVKKKEYPRAIENFLQALELNPRDASTYKNLGLCYHELGDKPQAYQSLKRAIELNPEYGKEIKIK